MVCSSIFTLTVVSFDRFLAAVFPSKAWITQSRQITIIIFIWLLLCIEILLPLHVLLLSSQCVFIDASSFREHPHPMYLKYIQEKIYLDQYWSSTFAKWPWSWSQYITLLWTILNYTLHSSMTYKTNSSILICWFVEFLKDSIDGIWLCMFIVNTKNGHGHGVSILHCYEQF